MSQALGTIETIGYVAAIVAADAAAKSANVRVLGAENARGAALVTVKMVGDVGAVKAAIAAAIAAVEKMGRVNAWQVIPRPHDETAPRAELADLGAKKGPSARHTWAPPEPAAPAPAPAPERPPEPPAAPVAETAAPEAADEQGESEKGGSAEDEPPAAEGDEHEPPPPRTGRGRGRRRR